MCSKLNAKVWLVMYVMYYYCAKSPWAGTRQLSINHQLQSLLVKVIKGSWFDYSVICLIDSHIVWSPSYLLCYESLISHIFNSPPASLTDISFISPLSLTRCVPGLRLAWIRWSIMYPTMCQHLLMLFTIAADTVSSVGNSALILHVLLQVYSSVMHRCNVMLLCSLGITISSCYAM